MGAEVDVQDNVDPFRELGEADNQEFKFSTKRFVLLALAEKAVSVVPTTAALPVLTDFQVEITPDRLRLLATDLELSLLAETQAVSASTSATVVFPAKKLLAILREAPDGMVTVQGSGDMAHISAGHATWDLRLQDGADYPELPDLEVVEFQTLNRINFLAAIKAVRYAVGRDAARANLLMVDIKQEKVTACDGVRFQQARLAGFPLDVQIPAGALDDLTRLLQATESADISLGETESTLVFKAGSSVFVVNKLMARFPDVEKLLLRPALENNQELHVDRSELIDSIRRIRITADTTTSAIGLRLSPGKLVVTSRDTVGNGADEELDVKWDGGDRMVVVNHTFLLEMLNMYDGKSCLFLLGKDTKQRKSMVMLRDKETGAIGVIQQMLGSLVGYE